YYGVWGEKFISPVHMMESRITHSYALSERLPNEAERRQQRGAEFFVGQTHASRSIIRVWRTLREMGLYQAARWLAAAHFRARLPIGALRRLHAKASAYCVARSRWTESASLSSISCSQPWPCGRGRQQTCSDLWSTRLLMLAAAQA